MKQKDITVLVTGSNAPGFSSIVRSLKLSKKYNVNLIASDWVDSIQGRYYATKSFKLPDNRSSDFADSLLNVCEKEKVDVLLPIRTDDQISICQNLKAFESIGTVPVINSPNVEIMNAAINKLSMLEYLQQITGIQVMDYRVASSKDEFENGLDELGYPDRPVAIKPVHASGSRGFRILDPTKDLKKLFFEEKPTNVFSIKEYVMDVLGDHFPKMLLMEYLVEPEYSIDALCYKGQLFAAVARKREKMKGGITVEGVVEALNTKTSTIIRQIIESYGFTYSVGLQFRRSLEDPETFHILEINPRLQGTTVLSIAAGVNVTELVIDMAFQEFDFDFVPKIHEGTRMERIYKELFEKDDVIFTLEDI
jgi:carbamoyl-phosphate synthase large subunit